MRINKYLAAHHPLTRRAADHLIAAGRVKLNGEVAKLGDLVVDGDEVTVAGGRPRYHYLAYHKPRGQKTEEIKFKNLFPIGRLDQVSRGLIILTNDGRLSGKILTPSENYEKEYVVTTDKTVTDEVIKELGAGVKIEKYRTKKAKVWKTNDKEFHIILTEGKKHQIRRMAAARGLQVTDLCRIRIGQIELADLPPSTTRDLSTNDFAFLAD